MAHIVYVKTPKTKGYITLGVSDGENTSAYTVTGITYSEIGSPVRGDGIDCDTLSRLVSEDELYRAERRALSILAYADNSERMLRTKLLRHGFSLEAVLHAVRTCAEHGYVNEERQLENKILSLANEKLRGRYYVETYLRGRGYPAEKIREAIIGLTERGEVDWRANFELLSKKLSADTEEERYSLMKKYGYKR